MARFQSRWFADSNRSRRSIGKSPRARLMLHGLEERCVPAVLTVTDNGDSGLSTQLRQVMATADSNGQDDTIQFSGVTNISLLLGNISLTTENKLLTIDGGAGVTISNGAGAGAANRIFNFNIAGGNPTITLQNLTLSNGNLNTNSGGAILLNNDPLVCSNVTFSNNKTVVAGGAIATTTAVTETITLTNCLFSGNSAGTVGGAIAGVGGATISVSSTSFTSNSAVGGSGAGGAINIAGASSSVTINSSTFTLNTCTGSTGGAINVTGVSTVTVTSAKFDQNTASSSNGGAFAGAGTSSTFNFTSCTITANQANGASGGGGLRFQGTSVTVTIDSTTISGNTANGSGSGGAISNTSTTAPALNITNSTISGNVGNGTGAAGIDLTAPNTTITSSTISGNSSTNAASNGGAIAISTGTLTVNNSTIYANTAGTTSGAGGGIRKSGTSAITLNSTIVAGNVASTAADIACTGGAVTIGGGSNLIGVADVGSFTLSGINKTGTNATPLDPMLNALGSNGGPTQTHSLKAKSPAFNQGSNVLSLSFDQRGPGFPRINGAKADVGAFEGVSPDPGAKVTLPNVPPINPTYQAVVVYSDDVAVDTTTIDTNDVVLSGPGYVSPVGPTTVTFSGPANSVTATYTFTPPGGSWDFGDDGVYTLTMQNNQVLDTDGPNPVASGALGTFAVTIALPNPLVVDNQGDVDDGNFSAGNLTLREAIRLSNATPGQIDSITFDASLSGKTITVGSALSITEGVTITGLGAANLKLSGGTVNQILNINLSNSAETVTLNKLKIADGNATAGSGGAVVVLSGNLTLDSVTLDSNQSTLASGAAGGAIAFNTAAKLTISNSTISNNTAAGTSTSTTGGGGAISTTAVSTITINNSLVTANTSTQDGGGVVRGQTTYTLNINDSTITNNIAGGFGGVAYMNSGSSAITIARTTVSGNTANGTGAAAGGGGGFYFFSSGTFDASNSTFSSNVAKTGGVLSFRGGTVVFTECTLSNNSSIDSSALSGGGAISMNAAAATITLNNSTVYANTAFNVGGGIRKNTTSTNFAIVLNSSIVAGNAAFGFASTVNYGADIDCSGVSAFAITGANNLIGISDAGNFSLSGSNKTGTKASPLDPLLDVLANNGGPTFTHALKAGSPAFDSGSNVLSLSFDQRGTGFPRFLQNGVDIGAFEGINPTPVYSGTFVNVPPINGTYQASVVYKSSVGINTATIDVNDVRLSGPGFGSPATPTTVTFSGPATSVTATYTFTPPGGSWDYTDDGTYQIDVQANQVYDTSPSPVAAVAGKVNTFQVNIPLPALVVDENSDNDDLDYSTGKLSLREAIKLANNTTNTTETITFDAALNGQTIDVSTLTITDPLQILGPGASKLTISGAVANSSIFVTNIATVGSPVLFSGLTISGGNGTTGTALTITGENVTVTDCVVSNNMNFGNGGAINVLGSAATLTVNNSTFDSNTSTAGGAITVQNNGALFVNNSLFTNNVTNGGNSGGAIRFIGSTTVAVNVAIRNSTFFGNKTNFSGGAIGFSNVFLGNALVQNCTIVGNTADADDNATGEGGGVALFSGAPPGKLVIESSIISGNFKGTASPVASDLSNGSTSTVDANFSLIGDVSATLNFNPDAKTTSLLGQNPLLNALANNGGPTQTMSIQSTSPAKNNGSNPAGLTNDQRGSSFARTSGPGTDVGAFEIQYPPTVTSVVFGDGTNQRSLVKQIVVTFSEPVTFMGGVASAFTLTRTGTGGTTGDVTLSTTATSPTNSVTLTFSGSLTEFGSLVDGLYDFTISAAQVSSVNGALDGNNDGIAGGSYFVNGTTANKFFRFFGDSDGSGTVDQAIDFVAFKNAFGFPSPIFDFNNNGTVDQAADFVKFKNNFGLSP